jgi:hypothetical protein
MLGPYRLVNGRFAICMAAVAIVCLPLAAATDAAAQCMPRGNSMQDMGTGLGIGIGIGVINRVIQQERAKAAEEQAAKEQAKRNEERRKALRAKQDEEKKKRAKQAEEKKNQARQAEENKTQRKPTDDKDKTGRGSEKPTTATRDDKPEGPPTPPVVVPPTQVTDNPPNTPATPPTTDPGGGSPPTQATGTQPGTSGSGTGGTTQTNTSQTAGNPPTTQTPPATQTAVAPPNDQVAPEECPQRGRGCIALIIDYAKFVFEDDLDKVSQGLKAIDCDTDYVAPVFKRIWAYKVGKYIPVVGYHYTSDVTPTEEEVAEAKVHNAAQRKLVDAAIDNHRTKIRTKKPEIAIEMVTAHGGAENWGLSMDWSIPEARIKRVDFHIGNYEAVKGGGPGKKSNVCNWFVLDSSCFSGNTPHIVDNLNNTGAAHFVEPPPDNCNHHAGYERDVAVGGSTSQAFCNMSVTRPLFEAMAKSLDNHFYGKGPRPNIKLIDRLTSLSSDYKSLYVDRGYKYCTPHDRKGYASK